MQVARLATPLTRAASAALFVPAYQAVFGEKPDRDRAELLIALMWLENANGQSIIQHNWGNLSTVARDNVSFWRPPWFDAAEIAALPATTPAEQARKKNLEALHQRMLDNKAPSAFRAFPDHAQGLAAWLGLLKNRPSILAAASSGDAVRFAHAIYESKYCTDVQCRDAGPTYGKLRDTAKAANYFADLKKKSSPAAALAWCSSLVSRGSAEPSSCGREVAGALGDCHER